MWQAEFALRIVFTKNMKVVPALLCVVLLVLTNAGCKRRTDAVHLGAVGIDFTIKLQEVETLDDSETFRTYRTFYLRGDIFAITEDRKELLWLAASEKLTVFDGKHEFPLLQDSSYNYDPSQAVGQYYFYPDSDKFSRDAPFYVLRYYRRDGDVLESRVETPALPDFVAPDRDSEWFPREQVLGVEWSQTTLPVYEVVLDSRCRVPGEDGETVMHFPVSETTRLDIDLTAKPHTEACNTSPPLRTYINLIQAPVSASSIDARFLGESRFELQRNRERHIRERT